MPAQTSIVARPEDAAVPADVARINLSWLVRLRWVAVGVQVLLVAGVYVGLEMDLPIGTLGGLAAVVLASNIGAAVWVGAQRPVPQALVAGVLALDVAVLTAMLYVTGGPANPFSLLYMVYIALAPVLLGRRWSLIVTVLAVVGFGLLFVLHDAWKGGHDHGSMRMHLEGMWVATAITAALIAWFVHEIRGALARRDAELAELRRIGARSDKLAALATMAAGAAHELATPLGTIAVASRELQRDLETRDDGGLAEDAALIRQEVDRCRDILGRLRSGSGQSPGEGAYPVTVAQLLGAVMARADRAQPVVVYDAIPDVRVDVPLDAVAGAVRNLLDNARAASPPDAPVELEATADGDDVILRVRDHGHGMPPEVLARVGEPFFTTRSPGEGMGLGVYVARGVVGPLGGTLELSSEPGEGTTATIRLPRAGAGR
ncbi:MAG: ATP-binding protein [Myxococcota bacterium]